MVWRLSSTYLLLCFKEILVPLIIRVLPCGTLSQTSNLENFVRALQVDRVVNDSSASTVELVDDTYRTIDESWLFTASRPAVTL